MTKGKAALASAAIATKQTQNERSTHTARMQDYGVKKRQTVAIGRALNQFADTRHWASQLFGCSTAMITGHQGDEDTIEAVYHCHKPWCQICRAERQDNWTRKISQAVNRYMLYDINGNREMHTPEVTRGHEKRVEMLLHRLAISGELPADHPLVEEVGADPLILQLNGESIRLDNTAPAAVQTKKLWAYLVTLTVKNPAHVWTGTKTYSEYRRPDGPACPLFTVSWPPIDEPPADPRETALAALEEEAAALAATIHANKRRRGNGARRMQLKSLNIQIAQIRHDLDHPNKLDELLWHPFRVAREHARLYPESWWAKLWRHVYGGVATTEVTFNTDPKAPAYHTFHPHMHMLLLADVPYLANQKPRRSAAEKKAMTPAEKADAAKAERLDKLWTRALQPFFPIAVDVDVRRVSDQQWRENPEAAIREVTKYLTKPEKLNRKGQSNWPAWAHREIAKATQGRRLINTFGILRVPEPDWDPNADGPAWTYDADRPGEHRLYRYHKGQYTLETTWPATAADPIIPAAERRGREAARSRDVIAIEKAFQRGEDTVDIYGQILRANGRRPRIDRDTLQAAKWTAIVGRSWTRIRAGRPLPRRTGQAVGYQQE